MVLDDIADPRSILPWWPDSHTGVGWVLRYYPPPRRSLTGGGRTLIPVDVYTREESAAYLTQRLIDEGARASIDGTAETLAQALGDLPLALSHAAAFIIDQHMHVRRIPRSLQRRDRPASRTDAGVSRHR